MEQLKLFTATPFWESPSLFKRKGYWRNNNSAMFTNSRQKRLNGSLSKDDDGSTLPARNFWKGLVTDRIVSTILLSKPRDYFHRTWVKTEEFLVNPAQPLVTPNSRNGLDSIDIRYNGVANVMFSIKTKCRMSC